MSSFEVCVRPAVVNPTDIIRIEFKVYDVSKDKSFRKSGCRSCLRPDFLLCIKTEDCL